MTPADPSLGLERQNEQAPPDPDLLFFCRIDRTDRIVELGGAAGDSIESDGLRTGGVLGSSLYSHVSGHFTRRFLQAFIAEARTAGTQPRRLYRCDSPQSRRLMEMRAVLASNGDLRLEHRLIQERDFDFPVRVQAAVRRGLAHYLRCSNCCHLRPIRGGVWREPEEYAGPDSATQVVHTICPSCHGGQAVRPLQPRPTS